MRNFASGNNHFACDRKFLSYIPPVRCDPTSDATAGERKRNVPSNWPDWADGSGLTSANPVVKGVAMLSSRRGAELGLLAACLVLVGSVAVVVAGANDGARAASSTVAQVQSASPVNTLATAQLGVVGDRH